jgi:hypothetical protein
MDESGSARAGARTRYPYHKQDGPSPRKCPNASVSEM